LSPASFVRIAFGENCHFISQSCDGLGAATRRSAVSP
jgi:hypothetical protein